MALPPPKPIKRMKHSDIPETSCIRNYRFLTLQGGGMKGIGYIGAIEELEATGVLTQIEEVAGSSAGAIIAALLAVGYTAKEIREVMINLDFRDLQDKDSPGWIESTGLKDILKGGVELVDRYNILRNIPLVKQAVALPGQLVRAAEVVEEIGSLAVGGELGLWSGKALLNIVSTMIARKTGKPNITFRELEALAQENPGVFRALTLTGSNLTAGSRENSLEYYNAREWPDMPIMDAVRISASFPGGFKPVSKPIVKKIHEDGRIEISHGVRVDGGLLENLPDVFNKDPYFKPSREQPGNPEALALSFKTKKSKHKEKVRTGLDLAGALYKAKMTEKPLQERYGDNIVYVDPKGVDTLDFDAEESRILALADSGGECTRACLTHLLSQEKEKEQNYEALSLKGLIRQEIALQRIIKNHEENDPKVQGIFKDLMTIGNLITKKRAGYSDEQLEQIRRYEESRFNAIKMGSENRVASVQDLIKSCQRKIDELDYTEKELETRVKQLNFVRVGLDLMTAEMNARFQKEDEDLEPFKHQLNRLDKLQKEIQGIRNELTQLGIQKPSGYLEKTRNLEAQYKKWVSEKGDFFDKIASQYREKDDTLMLHYFEELQKDSEKIHFNIPNTQEEIEEHLKKESEKCDQLIKEGIKELEKVRTEKKLFKARLQDFKNRNISASEYDALASLQTELDKSIQQRTSTLGKLLTYCVSEKPSNAAIALVQTLAFLAFVARIGLAVGTFFPAVTYFLAQLTKRFSKYPKAVAAANRVICAFHMPNLFKFSKLRDLSSVSAQFLEALNKNYHANAGKAGQTYLYGLFKLYLEKSGLSFKDIFLRKEDETEKAYEDRIKLFQDKLKAVKSSEDLLAPSPDFLKNMGKFRTAVMKVLNLSKSADAQAPTFLFQRSMNEKLKKMELPEDKELCEYIKSSIACKTKIPPPIQQLFLDNIKEKIKQKPPSKRRLNEEELVLYLKLEPTLTTTKVIAIRSELVKDEEYRAWLSKHEPPKRKEEIEQAWNTFFELSKRSSKTRESQNKPKEWSEYRKPAPPPSPKPRKR